MLLSVVRVLLCTVPGYLEDCRYSTSLLASDKFSWKSQLFSRRRKAAELDDGLEEEQGRLRGNGFLPNGQAGKVGCTWTAFLTSTGGNC